MATEIMEIPEVIPEDIDGRSDQYAWDTARRLTAMCNGSCPTRLQMQKVVGDTMSFNHSSHVTRALIYIEHSYIPTDAREAISELIREFVQIPTND